MKVLLHLSCFAPDCSSTLVILQDREEKTRTKEKGIAEKNQGNQYF